MTRSVKSTMALLGLLLSLIIALTFGLLAWRDRVKLHASEAAAQEHRRFLSRLDHELKNPLTAIRAGLANLAEPSGNPANPETLASLEAQVLRMSRLSSDLRKLAEIGALRTACRLIFFLRKPSSWLKNSQGIHRTLNRACVPWPLPTTQGDGPAVHGGLQPAGERLGSAVLGHGGAALEDRPEVVIEVMTQVRHPDEEQPLVWGAHQAKLVEDSGSRLGWRSACSHDRHGEGWGLRVASIVARFHPPPARC
jgi:two-component system OmpR family sensor kinase